MLRRQTRIQLAVFGVLAAIALTVLSLEYAGLPAQLGFGQMKLTADFADTSGLYAGARVTYRGVDVGRVKEIATTPTGVDVRMSISASDEIPSDARAEIHSTSAIGEQYVDLVPSRDAGPYLTDGSVIPQSRTQAMPQAGDTLDSVTTLIRSVPSDQLAQLLHEVETAFAGTHDDLESLVTASSSFLRTAIDKKDQTVDLLDTSVHFLNTQTDIRSQVAGSVGNLADVTAQLVRSRQDLVQLLKSGKPFADEVTDLVKDMEPTLPVLLANMTTTSQVLLEYLPGVQQTLVVLPPTLAGYQAAFLPYAKSGQVVLDFKTNSGDSPVCTQGFLPGSQWRATTDTRPISTPPGLHCTSGDPSVLVRGSKNYPCLLYPGVRASSPVACAERATGASPPPVQVAYLPEDSRSTGTTTYEPVTGRFLGPDGFFYSVGPNAARVPADWQHLLLSTIR